MKWKFLDSKIEPRGRNVYTCEDCPRRYFEVYTIGRGDERKKLCENCLEPYFREEFPTADA